MKFPTASIYPSIQKTSGQFRHKWRGIPDFDKPWRTPLTELISSFQFLAKFGAPGVQPLSGVRAGRMVGDNLLVLPGDLVDGALMPGASLEVDNEVLLTEPRLYLLVLADEELLVDVRQGVGQLVERLSGYTHVSGMVGPRPRAVAALDPAHQGDRHARRCLVRILDIVRLGHAGHNLVFRIVGHRLRLRRGLRRGARGGVALRGGGHRGLPDIVLVVRVGPGVANLQLSVALGAVQRPTMLDVFRVAPGDLQKLHGLGHLVHAHELALHHHELVCLAGGAQDNLCGVVVIALVLDELREEHIDPAIRVDGPPTLLLALALLRLLQPLPLTSFTIWK